jgi:hypothetical protein
MLIRTSAKLECNSSTELVRAEHGAVEKWLRQLLAWAKSLPSRFHHPEHKHAPPRGRRFGNYSSSGWRGSHSTMKRQWILASKAGGG